MLMLNHSEKFGHELIEKLNNIIEREMDKGGPAIDLICKDLGMSRTTLYREIASYTGKGVKAYIRDYKLRKAYSLLASGDITISEVALIIGYKNLSSFSKSFKDAYGYCPSNFLRTQR
jgi:AraC-like DNA-binding protein